MFVRVDETTTPVGSPPPGPGLPGLPENKPPVTEAPNAIMEALANIVRQNGTAASVHNGVSAPTPTYSMPPAQAGITPQPTLPLGQNHTPVPYATPQQPVSLPGMPYPYAQPGQVQTSTPVPSVTPSNQVPGFPGVALGAPAAPAPAPGMDPNVQQQVMLIKLLADQGVPFDKIPAIIASMQSNSVVASNAATPAAAPPVGQPPYATGSWGQVGFRPDEPRDHDFQQVRSPNRYRNHSRSRSPPRHWDARDSPRGRSDREFGSFGRNSPGLGRMDDRDRRPRGADYRQRSPSRRGRSATPQHSFPPGAKWAEYDRTIPTGHIKGKLFSYAL